MVVVDRAEDFQMGRVVSRTFGALTVNAMTFLILATVLMIPVLVTDLYFTRTVNTLSEATVRGPQGAAIAMASFSHSIATNSLSLLVVLVFTFLLQATLVQGTVTYLNGEKPNLGNCLSTGVKSVLPLIGLALLSYFGLVLGFLLLVVPGIILMVMWAVVVPVLVVEHPGVFASFGRSRSLTKGHRWKIFGLILLYILIFLGVELAVALAMGVSMLRPGPANFAPGYMIANWIFSVPLMALAAVGVAAIYYELRLVKEGVGPQQLAAAFD